MTENNRVVEKLALKLKFFHTHTHARSHSYHSISNNFGSNKYQVIKIFEKDHIINLTQNLLFSCSFHLHLMGEVCYRLIVAITLMTIRYNRKNKKTHPPTDVPKWETKCSCNHWLWKIEKTNEFAPIEREIV